MTLKSAQESDKLGGSTLSGSAAEAAQMAIEAGLVYVSDTEPGIRRLRAGRGFRYVTPENRRLAAGKDLKRIASLAIPPAYRDVWITMKPRGHLQATGRDARGRKQYRYHSEWREGRGRAKNGKKGGGWGGAVGVRPAAVGERGRAGGPRAKR